MKNWKSSTIAGLAIMFLVSMSACKGDQNEANSNDVSPDLIENPVTASGKKVKSNLPIMEFDSEEHDFGLIMEGEKVSHTFTFTNAGGADLLISSASATCGCTIPKYPRKPIKPGEKGQVEVLFNSAGKGGANHKSIKLLTNAQPNTIELKISAEVYVPKK